MRDLFSFIFGQRHTLLFLLLMFASLYLLFNRNNHHKATFLSTSNQIAGDALTFRSDLSDYMDLKEENDKLRKENAEARSRHKSSYSPVENSFVRINDTIHKQFYRYVDSRIVNSTYSKQKNYLTLKGGLKDGLRPDMGVLGHDGIIGIVRHCGEDYSVALSVLNPLTQVSVEFERTGHFGIFSWNTSDPTTASVTDVAKHAQIQKGDLVMTRGSGGIFPRGIPVGEVIEVIAEPGSNYLEIVMRLFQDMTRTNHAYVVMDLYKHQKDSLENLVAP